MDTVNPRRHGRTLLRGALLAALIAAVGGAYATAEAGVHVFVGGAVGVPAVPYPYPYYAPYPYYGPYPYGPEYGAPPPGWEPGHWELRHDPSGRPLQVWVPGHLR